MGIKNYIDERLADNPRMDYRNRSSFAFHILVYFSDATQAIRSGTIERFEHNYSHTLPGPLKELVDSYKEESLSENRAIYEIDLMKRQARAHLLKRGCTTKFMERIIKEERAAHKRVSKGRQQETSRLFGTLRNLISDINTLTLTECRRQSERQ